MSMTRSCCSAVNGASEVPPVLRSQRLNLSCSDACDLARCLCSDPTAAVVLKLILLWNRSSGYGIWGEGWQTDWWQWSKIVVPTTHTRSQWIR